jgi:SagB-type dehydrogenase family enzyme
MVDTLNLDRIAHLTPERKALFELLLAEQRTEGGERPAAAGLPPVVPDPGRRCEPFPLNDIQEAYWVGRAAGYELGDVGNHGYAEFACGRLDAERLGAAWNRLIERHEMLRAVVLPGGEQRVLPEVPPYRIEDLDLSAEPPGAAEARLAAVREAMSHQVRPAGEWPLFEVRLTRLAGGRDHLHFSIDGLLIDSWSCQILFSELSRLYFEPAAELPPLALSFRDYVLAERGLAGSELFRAAEAYWQERLPAFPPAPALPLACPPRSLARPRFVRRSGRLTEAEWSALRAHALDAGRTAAEVLLAVWAEVLALWCETPRFTLNVPISHRLPLHPDVQRIAGEFVSSTLVAVDASEPASFRERARELGTQLWRNLDHSMVTGVRLLRMLARRQGPSAGGMLPVVFSCNLISGGSGADIPVFPVSLGRLVHHVTQTPQVWLDHLISEDEGELVYDWDAVEDLFPPGLLDEMFAAYRSLLRRLATDGPAWDVPVRRLLRPPAPPRGTDGRRVVDDRGDERPAWVPGRIVAAGAGGEAATGELGRRLPDGSLQILGRERTTLRLGGRSVDVEQVEAALAAHPRVRRAAVVASGEAARLVAWVEAQAAPEPEAGAIPGALAGAGARTEFKLAGPGLRRFPPDAYGIALAAPPDPAAEASVLGRRSYRRWARAPVSGDALGALVAALRRVELAGAPVPKLRYPSAGGLYPVQVYLWLEPGAVAGLPAGPFYYDPREHRLLPLGPGGGLPPGAHLPVNREIAAGAGLTLLLVADLAAIEPLYGAAARDFCLLEAGAIAQLLMEQAPRHGIGLCPVSRVLPEMLFEPLGLGPSHEILHALIGGRIEPAQQSAGGWLRELAAAAARPRSARQTLAGELQEHVERELSHLGVPLAVIPVEALPREPGGGVDRAALAGWERGPAAPATASRTAIESTLEALWREVLGEAPAGLDDNFFDLGGTSLHLVQLRRLLQERLQADLSIVDLLQAPTLRALARSLERESPAEAAVGQGWERAAVRQAARRERPRRRFPDGAGGEGGPLR